MASSFSEEAMLAAEPVRFEAEHAEIYTGMDTGERAILLEEDIIELPGGIGQYVFHLEI